MLLQSTLPTLPNFDGLRKDIYMAVQEFYGISQDANGLPEWVNYLVLLAMNKGEGEEICLLSNHNSNDLSHDCLMGRRFDLKKIAFTSYELGCLEIEASWTTVVIWQDSTGQTCYQGF